MNGHRMVGGVGRLVLCIAALGTMAAVCPESLSTTTPESYPATRLIELDGTSAEAKSLDDAFDELDVVKPTLEPKKGPFIGGLVEKVPLKPRRWWKVSPHPYLRKVLPDVAVYVALGAQGRSAEPGAPPADWLIASSKGRLYPLPDKLNQLLCDNGMQFTGSDVQVWARLACMVWASVFRGERVGSATEGGRRSAYVGEEYWKLPAIPAISFERVFADTGEADTVAVYLTIRGQSMQFRVAAWQMELGSGTSRHIGLVPWGVVPTTLQHPMPLRGPGSSSRLDDAPKLDVPKGVDVRYSWYEDIDEIHPPLDSGVYCVVERDGLPTQGQVRFDVNDVSGFDKVYILLANQYTIVSERLEISIDNGCGSGLMPGCGPFETSIYKVVM
jgi:hypothetical protein